MEHSTDREKVINGLELIIWEVDHNSMWLPGADDIRDALALLKEQEAVKPVPPEDEFGLYRCGKCYHQLFRCVDKYCSRCGQAVKWE